MGASIKNDDCRVADDDESFWKAFDGGAKCFKFSFRIRKEPIRTVMSSNSEKLRECAFEMFLCCPDSTVKKLPISPKYTVKELKGVIIKYLGLENDTFYLQSLNNGYPTRLDSESTAHLEDVGISEHNCVIIVR